MVTLAQIVSTLKSRGRYWLVFTGDSITSCEWVHPNWREIVEYVLKEETTKALGDWQLSEWGIRAFNFAYDGATTKDIVDKLDDILLVKPDLVLSLMGGNDPAFNLSVAEHVENIKTLAQRVTSAGARLVWSSSTPAGHGSAKNPQYEPYAKASMEIGPIEGVQLLDMYHLYQGFPLDRFFTFTSEANPVEGIKAGDPDLQHPNVLGNAYIAKVVLKEVFALDFDPEKYHSDTRTGVKYPGY